MHSANISGAMFLKPFLNSQCYQQQNHMAGPHLYFWANQNTWQPIVTLWKFQRYFPEDIFSDKWKLKCRKPSGHFENLALAIYFYYKNGKNAVPVEKLTYIIHYFYYKTDLDMK